MRNVSDRSGRRIGRLQHVVVARHQRIVLKFKQQRTFQLVVVQLHVELAVVELVVQLLTPVFVVVFGQLVVQQLLGRRRRQRWRRQWRRRQRRGRRIELIQLQLVALRHAALAAVSARDGPSLRETVRLVSGYPLLPSVYTAPQGRSALAARGGGERAGFADLGLGSPIASVLEELGYEEPTPIQKDAIPPLLAGRDVLGQAATGTGKTAAFALPLLQRVFAEKRPPGGPALLVLVPTRELAMQVAEALHRYGRKLGARVLPIYGGQSLNLQFRALSRGVDAVVATPGRALDHVRRGTLALGQVQAIVLDEADEMLDMGFAEDLEAILGALPEERQTALFSATLPKRIVAIAERHLSAPVRIAIPDERLAKGDAPRVRQAAYLVSRAHKVDALGRILDHESPASALVFCRTRNEVEELTEALRAHGHRAEALHGGMSQKDRDRVMKRFRDGSAELLLATDVAARGLDIGHISHVINYDVPSAPESYVHRIGRTGRAGREGAAVTLVEARERHLLRNIERLTGRRLELKTVPSVADLRARQLEQTRATLREALVAGGAESFRVVVESLAEEFDVIDVAAAAVKMAHGGRALPDGPEIPTPSLHAPERPPQRDRGPRAPAGHGRGSRPSDERARPPRAAAPGTPGSQGAPARDREPGAGPFTKLYVSAGQSTGVRAADLVGAITNEAGLDGRDVGTIEIADRYSLVDVRKSRADEVLDALRRTLIRGRKVSASRYRQPKAKG